MQIAKTIVGIAYKDVWERAAVTGEYVQSTLDSTLAEVGFIHCSLPSQTLEIVNRKFFDRDDLVLLLIDEDKVSAPIKHEAALSGRAGTFPHIYGPLNVDAVYKVLPIPKDNKGKFVAPAEFEELETAAE